MTEAPDNIWVNGSTITEWRGDIDDDGHDPRIGGCTKYRRADIPPKVKALVLSCLEVE